MKARRDEKVELLRSRGALHTHPERVQDDLFRTSTFFDPRDRLQVCYEMLRRHQVDGQKVAQTARAFGVSRQHFYLLERAFEARGFFGLLPQRRGPKRARKCSAQVLEHVQVRRRESTTLSWDELVDEVAANFAVRVHPRTLQRALARQGKKRRPATGRSG